MQPPTEPPQQAPAALSDPDDDRRRRRLLFRATHCGTKENDVLLGGFVARRLAGLDAAELEALELILDLPDPDLAAWLSGRRPLPDELAETALGVMLRRIRAESAGA